MQGVQRLLGQEGQRRVGGAHQADGGRLPLQGQQGKARGVPDAEPVPNHPQPLHRTRSLHLPQLFVVRLRSRDLVTQDLVAGGQTEPQC